jgi:hypothetical protein
VATNKKVSAIKEDIEPESDYGNPENHDKEVLKKKEGLMLDIIQTIQSIESQKGRATNDKQLIGHLHHYNYLKDAVYKLAEAMSNIRQCSSK